MTFAEAAKKVRIAADLSYKEMSQRIKRHPNTVYEAERGATVSERTKARYLEAFPDMVKLLETP